MMLVSGKRSAAGSTVLIVWIMICISRICEATMTVIILLYMIMRKTIV